MMTFYCRDASRCIGIAPVPIFRARRHRRLALSELRTFTNKKKAIITDGLIPSGYQDLNLGPPAPKA